MGIVSVHRGRKTGVSYLTAGAQFIDSGGTLTFPPTGQTTIYLNPDVYENAGDYVLFDYAGGSIVNDPVTTIDYNSDDLILAGNPVTIWDSTNEKIVVRLGSNPYNGTQYIDAGETLTIIGNPVIWLNPTLYKTAQMYVLFSFTDTTPLISGNLADIVFVSNRSVGTPTVVGNEVQITLA